MNWCILWISCPRDTLTTQIGRNTRERPFRQCAVLKHLCFAVKHEAMRITKKVFHLLLCRVAVVQNNPRGKFWRLDPRECEVHPGQWNNNPEYTGATTKLRPGSYTGAYVHRPKGSVPGRVGHTQHMPGYDVCKIMNKGKSGIKVIANKRSEDA